MAYMDGEETDAESGLPHLWHVLTNADFAVAITEEGRREEEERDG